MSGDSAAIPWPVQDVGTIIQSSLRVCLETRTMTVKFSSISVVYGGSVLVRPCCVVGPAQCMDAVKFLVRVCFYSRLLYGHVGVDMSRVVRPSSGLDRQPRLVLEERQRIKSPTRSCRDINSLGFSSHARVFWLPRPHPSLCVCLYLSPRFASRLTNAAVLQGRPLAAIVNPVFPVAIVRGDG